MNTGNSTKNESNNFFSTYNNNEFKISAPTWND